MDIIADIYEYGLCIFYFFKLVIIIHYALSLKWVKQVECVHMRSFSSFTLYQTFDTLFNNFKNYCKILPLVIY